jgi:hypothetical protein
LWTTNGSAIGTNELSVSGASASGLAPNDMTVFNSQVLFNGTDTSDSCGVWLTNGTAGGTHEITGIVGAPTTRLGLDPSDLTVFGTEALFNGADASGDVALWETDGTAGGTHEISGIAGANASGLHPNSMAVLGKYR